MSNTYSGLTLPLIASATATFLFRQFFMTLPDELMEAARIDGAGAMRFFWDVVLPLSKTNMAALFVITFIYGWNQYLWPILIYEPAIADHGGGRHQEHDRVRRHRDRMASRDDRDAARDLPPLAVVLTMQRWFVRGLVDSEK